MCTWYMVHIEKLNIKEDVLGTLILVGTSRPHKDKAKNTNFLVGTDCGDLFLTHTFSES